MNETNPNNSDLPLSPESQDEGLPPNRMRSLFLSFLLVATAFVFFFLTLFGVYVGLAAAVAPDVLEKLGSKPDQFNNMIENDPMLIWPGFLPQMFLVAGAVIAIGFGFLVTHWARFSHFAHGGILGLVTFVTLLQMSLSRPASPQWIVNACMLLFPAAIILGSFLRTRCCAGSQAE